MTESSHKHLCKDGREKSQEICAARGYCVCACGQVAPHPRSIPAKQSEWCDLSTAFANQSLTPALGR